MICGLFTDLLLSNPDFRCAMNAYDAAEDHRAAEVDEENEVRRAAEVDDGSEAHRAAEVDEENEDRRDAEDDDGDEVQRAAEGDGGNEARIDYYSDNEYRSENNDLFVVVFEELGRAPGWDYRDVLTPEEARLLHELNELSEDQKRSGRKRFRKAQKIDLLVEILSSDTLLEGACVMLRDEDLEEEGQSADRLMEILGIPRRWQVLKEDPVFRKRKEYCRRLRGYVAAAVCLYGCLQEDEILGLIDRYEPDFARQRSRNDSTARISEMPSAPTPEAAPISDYDRPEGGYRRTLMFSPEYLCRTTLREFIKYCVPQARAATDGFIVDECFCNEITRDLKLQLDFAQQKLQRAEKMHALLLAAQGSVRTEESERLQGSVRPEGSEGLQGSVRLEGSEEPQGSVRTEDLEGLQASVRTEGSEGLQELTRAVESGELGSEAEAKKLAEFEENLWNDISYRRLYRIAQEKEMYCPPSREAFLRFAGDPDPTPAEQQLRTFLQRHYRSDFQRHALEHPDATAEDALEIFMYDVAEIFGNGPDCADTDANDSFRSFFELVNKFGIHFRSEKDVNRVLRYISDIANNTRLWVNHGYTPNELRRLYTSRRGPGAESPGGAEFPGRSGISPEGTSRDNNDRSDRFDSALPTIVAGSTEAARMLEEGCADIEKMGFRVDLDSNADEIPTFSMPKGQGGPVVSSTRKIYPNDPCPCGSGKKYKKCCGRARR